MASSSLTQSGCQPVLAPGAVTSARAVRNDVLDGHALAGLARVAHADDLELDLEPGAASLQTPSTGEARALDVEPLPLLGLDVAVVLLLVEPLHPAAHQDEAWCGR